MKVVRVTNLAPGMKLGEDITVKVAGKRKVMLAYNHKLEPNEIDWLARRGIKTVKILESSDAARDLVLKTDIERLSQQAQPIPTEVRKYTEKEVRTQFSRISAFVKQRVNLDEFRAESVKEMQTRFKEPLFVRRIGETIAELRTPVMNIIKAILSSNQTSVNLCSLKSIDNYTHEHCLNVAIICVSYGRAFQHKDETSRTILADLFNLAMAGVLHDLGKTLIPRSILNKSGGLSDTEWEAMKMHPMYGWNILEQQSMISNYGKLAVLQHHINADGSGYPQKIAHKTLSMLTKILSVADRYDAMTSDRPYRAGVPLPDAIRMIHEEGKLGWLDPEVVKNFINLVGICPVGTIVIGLEEPFVGVKGLVTGLSLMDPSKPIITFVPGQGEQVKVNTQKEPVKFRIVRAFAKDDIQDDLPEDPEGEVSTESLNEDW